MIKDRDAAVNRLATLEQEWQKGRAQLFADKAKLTAQVNDLQTRVTALTTEVEPLRTARERWEGDLKKLTDERSALVAKIKAMEKDWQVREATVAEEKNTLRRQVQESSARLGALQQDYEKVKSLHADLAGETSRKADEWTAREQRLTSEKNQLKVDLERVQGELSDMMRRTGELQMQQKTQSKDLEVAWEREKTSLKAQLDEARKAAGIGAQQSQTVARLEAEKRALQGQIDALRNELATSGKSKESATALNQARRDFEAKFRVIYDQSHDLNSPLNAIIGFSEILLDERNNKTSPEERREFLSHINESGKRLVEHIRELIEFAKQEAGIQERPVAIVPPAGVPNSKPPIILVADNDPAVRERIEPFLSHAGYEVVIAASAQEALKKAVQLQPLAVLIDTQLPPNGGSGLLYDLKREQKTRDIPVVLTSKVNKESLGFDIGQADFLTKPIDRQQLLQMMVKFDLLADGKRGRKTPAKILIVDDDPQNIRLVKAMLKPFNMEVLVADGGKTGLEMALKDKPDLLILDLMMPDVDGFEVVSRLREDPAGSQIPILIYTAKNISSEDRERLQGNIQSIIQKGDFGKDRFLEMINNLQTAQAS
jgi:CheY-like chemotaxis protein/predicted  nucleic acid-binding Zn-ribbon protein